ncbi:MAG TPA: TIM barrel protein [Methanothrix sp.]|nr:TIM barrel protein [Methanothrix sp.]
MMDMKLGISTWAYLDLPLDQALDRISMLSTRAEILCEGRHSLFRPENLDTASSYSLRYSIHGPIADINIASIYHEFREASVNLHRQAIIAGAAIGAELYIIHPGYTPWSFCWGDALTCLYQSLSDLAPLQDELGISLVLENMPKSEWLFFKKPDLDLHGLGLVLDIGHAHTCGTLQEFLGHPALTHVHLHDNSGEGDEHLALGQGGIDLMPVLEKIRERGLTAALEQKSEAAVVESLAVLNRLHKTGTPLPKPILTGECNRIC